MAKIATAALLLTSGVIVSMPRPARHNDIINSLDESIAEEVVEQGFLTSTGEFLSRRDAYVVAAREGQILFTCGGPRGTLYSDHMWKKEPDIPKPRLDLPYWMRNLQE